MFYYNLQLYSAARTTNFQELNNDNLTSWGEGELKTPYHKHVKKYYLIRYTRFRRK